MDEKKDFVGKLMSFLYKNKVKFRDFGYLLGVVVLLFGIEYFFFPTNQLFYYAISAIAVAASIFGLRTVIARAFHISLKEKIWPEGVIFSVVVTLLLTAVTGLPLPVLVSESPSFSRAMTLAGLQKDEIKVHERWSVSLFSSMAMLAVSMLFLFAFTKYDFQFLLQSAFILIAFNFVSFLPYYKFEGALLAYHNILLYGILLLILFLTVVLAPITLYGAFYATLGVFIGFCVVSIATRQLHLW